MDIIDNNICTICLENNDNILIFPCKCKNPIHIDCLITWISYKKKFVCEICKDEYKIPNNILKNSLESFDIEEQISNNLELSNNYQRNIYEQLIIERNNNHEYNKLLSNFSICFLLLGIWLMCVYII